LSAVGSSSHFYRHIPQFESGPPCKAAIIDAFLKFDAVGTSLVITVGMQIREKGGETMKIATLFLAALLLAGSVGVSNTFAAAEGVISNATLTPGSYCHLRFPAIDEQTLSWDRPVLKDASSGDIVDFYGPCDTDPLGKDQVEAQKLQAEHQWDREINGD
jgi:hypothetical protein